MATYITYSIMSANNDANFRIWGKAISDGLQAVGGIVKLSSGDSSGQIDWTSVTRPTVSDTVAGYEMYRFDDTFQSSYPVFIKIEYGTGTYGVSSYHTGLWITVGFAHDGAGTITGFKQTSGKLATTNNYAVPTYTNTRIVAASNRLACEIHSSPGSATNQPRSFSVERTHAADGSDTNYGVIFILYSSVNSTWNQHLITFAGGVIWSETSSGGISCLAPSTGHGSAGGITTLYPIWCAAGPYFSMSHQWIGAFSGNVAYGVPFSVTLNGGLKTFILGRQLAYDSSLTARGVTLAPCIRWD